MKAHVPKVPALFDQGYVQMNGNATNQCWAAKDTGTLKQSIPYTCTGTFWQENKTNHQIKTKMTQFPSKYRIYSMTFFSVERFSRSCIKKNSGPFHKILNMIVFDLKRKLYCSFS